MIRLAGIAALIVAPSLLSAQDVLRRQVDSLHAAMVAAFKVDPASTKQFYTDDAAVVGGGMRVVGRAGVDAYWSQMGAGSTWELEVLDVGGIPEAPWVHGRSTLKSGSGGGMVTEYIGLLQRGIDGQLRFRVDAYVGSAASTATAGDEAAVRKLDSLWARMYATHDTAAALQLYAEPLVFLGSGGHEARAQELADIRPAAGLVMEYFRTTPATVRTFDRVAIVSGIADWRFTQNGTPRTISRPYTSIYARGGPLGWRIVAQQMGDGRVSRGR